MKTSCDQCTGTCCRDLSVEIDKPENFEDFETIKWFIAHKNVSVYIDVEGDWLIEFKTDCKFLDRNNLCRIYGERYKICAEHDPSECVMNSEEQHYERLFRTAEEVDAYMKEIGFYGKYVRQKKRLINMAPA